MSPRRIWALLSLLPFLRGADASAAPLRTPSPGTGVYHGFAVSSAISVGSERGGGQTLRETIVATELRYTPATSWSFALTVPRVERSVASSGRGTASRSGLGDVVLTGKYRFFRQLGQWGDRQAAVQVGVKLPTGDSRAAPAPGLPLALARAGEPGSGSTDGFVDLAYQQAHGRFVQAADLGWRGNGEDRGFRFGGEAHLDLDAEAIALPLDYQAPGHELFTLLEASLIRREADTFLGRALVGTRRTELLVAPGLEYVATEQLALGLSVALPLVSRVDPGGRKSRWNARLEARYAF